MAEREAQAGRSGNSASDRSIDLRAKAKAADTDKITLWDCSKGATVISCKFEGSE